MPTDLGNPYRIDWRGRPPHMLDPDVPVWYRFLDSYGPYFKRLFYDSLLGGPFMTPEQLADPIMKMWRTNTAKRTDAIAELENEIWIIEVASYPGLRSLGQLQVYENLWREAPGLPGTVRLVLVCERIDQDLGAAAAKQGVMIYIV